MIPNRAADKGYKRLNSILNEAVFGTFPKNESDIYELAKRGVRVEAVKNVANFFEFNEERIASILDTSIDNPDSEMDLGESSIGFAYFDRNGKIIKSSLGFLKGVEKRKALALKKKKAISAAIGESAAPISEDKLAGIEGLLLNKKTSEHILKIVELIGRGTEVFENEEKFKRWLNTPIGAFQGKKPIEYIDTITGIEMILDELGRIEHGIFY